MSGHNEKLTSTQVVLLRDQAGKAFLAGEKGMVILSGTKLYLNDGTSWKLITSA